MMTFNYDIGSGALEHQGINKTAAEVQIDDEGTTNLFLYADQTGYKIMLDQDGGGTVFLTVVEGEQIVFKGLASTDTDNIDLLPEIDLSKVRRFAWGHSFILGRAIPTYDKFVEFAPRIPMWDIHYDEAPPKDKRILIIDLTRTLDMMETFALIKFFNPSQLILRDLELELIWSR